MKRTGLFCFIPSCYRRGQCRQGSRKMSKIQNHLHPSEGTSHLDSALVCFGSSSCYSPADTPLCHSVLCVWGGAGGAGDLWWWVHPFFFISCFISNDQFWRKEVLNLFSVSHRCDHWWMGFLPSSTGRWHHQSGAARILPRQLPGRWHSQGLKQLKWFVN